MNRLVLSMAFMVLLYSCNKEKHFCGPNFYEDDFISYDSIQDLIDGDNERWSFF